MAETAQQQPDPTTVPPIAVCLPTYNRSGALITCLQHLERQTFTDFEVVIVDDGSPDDTPQRLEAFLAQTHLSVRTLRQVNSGPARARNVALTLVTAPITVFIGDDIFVSPDFVAEHLRFHQQHPETAEAAVGLTRWAQTGQQVTPFMRWLDESGTQFSYNDLLAGKPASWLHFYTSNLSLKTSLLRANPFHEGFAQASMEDIELGYRLDRQHGLRMTFLPLALADHLHPTNFMQAARRLNGIGQSMFVFHQLWPEQKGVEPRPRPWPLRALVRAAWIRSLLTRITAALTGVWCPNPLMAPVLALHSSLGYRQAEARAGKHLA